MYKYILALLIFLSSLNAAFQEVRIGKIDSFYGDKLSHEDLRLIIEEIEDTFESQLNVNVFDYSASGKTIDILYVPASKLERRIKSKIDRLNNKQKKIDNIQDSFPNKQEKIDILTSEIKYTNSVLNDKIIEFNNYVKEINERKNINQEEFSKTQKHVKSQKKKLDREIRSLKSDKNKLKKLVSRYNQSIRSYNNQIREYSRLNKEIESMSRSFRKIKGKTFGVTETIFKTYYKNGKKLKEESVTTSSMNKIEIYGFNSIDELKAVLAHEIAHLVGLPHIESQDALMNPILQKNQIKELYLTDEDIQNFHDHF